MEYIYVLHFDEPLSHAQHYVGSTTNLPQRTKAHCEGLAARLTQVLAERGIGWTVAAIYAPRNPRELRTIERRIKKQKHHAQYCPICTKHHNSPKGTIQHPVPKDLLHEPIHHKREHNQPPNEGRSGATVQLDGVDQDPANLP